MSLCLNLIVKQEEDNIIKCLESFNQLNFQAVAIVDTGSTDKTIELINNWVKENNKKGGVVSRPWKEEFGPFHFGFNRNLALDYASQLISKEESKDWYILFADADDILVLENELVLKDDAYFAVHKAETTFLNVKLIKYDPEKKWRWLGGLHEIISPMTQVSSSVTNSFTITSSSKGLRKKDKHRFFNDYLFLKTLIVKEPLLETRHRFYLAQSLRDMGLDELSQLTEKKYLERARLSRGDIEERYVSYVEAYKQRCKRKQDEKGASYLREAMELFPERLEAVFYYIRYLVVNKHLTQARILGKEYINKETNGQYMFKEEEIYDHAFRDQVKLL